MKPIVYGSIVAVVLLIIILTIIMIKEKFTWNYTSPNNVVTGSYNTSTGGAATYSQKGKIMMEMDANGNISTSATLPIGAIIAWYGTKDTIPVGWILCDGNNGTPNLSQKSIRGATNDTDFGAVGNETVTLGLNNIPAHTHGVKMACYGSECPLEAGGDVVVTTSLLSATLPDPTWAQWSDTNPIFPPTNGGTNLKTIPDSISLLPPSFNLYYIMKSS